MVNTTFFNKLKNYNSQEISLIKKAYDFAELSHANQKRESGEDYFTHPLGVATIMVSMGFDFESICAALLHDTVEDTEINIKKIEEKFGKNIAHLVDGVTKLAKIKFRSGTEKSAENFRKFLIATSSDIRVLIIKLIDRLHNMRTIHGIKKKEKRIRKAEETLLIFAPLAERVGMYKVKNELEDLSFEQIHHDERVKIKKNIEKTKKTKKGVIEYIIRKLKNKIQAEAGIKCTIYGREKRPYSIWKKIRRKNISFERLFDIIAFRIIVDDIHTCYRVLGIVNSQYRMIPNKFKDYISNPKENGYQSLHTVVLGPKNVKIEVQIRTEKMHQVAEFGVASHWLYKQDVKDTSDLREYKWIRELVSTFEKSKNVISTFKNTKLQMHGDEVFCFTPMGDVFNLPKGSSVIDFAYAVHSDVGNKCSGAKVNGNIVQLKAELSNGDEVEIITSKNTYPSPAWLNIAKTSKAKSEIKHYIRIKKKKEYESLGRKITQEFFDNLELKLTDKIIEKNLDKFQQNKVREIYAFIGEGLLSANDLFKKIYPKIYKAEKTRNLKEKLTKKIKGKKQDGKSKKHKKELSIEGLIPGMAIKFAKCCFPVPGDEILGVIHTGIGVTVHKTDCKNLKNMFDLENRSIPLKWKSGDQVQEEKYVVKIVASLENKPGVFAKLFNIFAERKINVTNVRTLNKSIDVQEVEMEINVANTEELADILAYVRILKPVYSVKRC